MSGFIKLHRSLIEWQYWDDHNTTRLLIYFLISVNYESKKWKGIEIKAGQFITSFDKISLSTGLSIKQIRRSIKLLVDCREITQETTNKFQRITLVKWNELQLEENKRAIKGQSKDNQRECQRATTKEVKEIKNNTNNTLSCIISDRKEKFKDDLSEFLVIYKRELLNDFFVYWTEENKLKTKMRFEYQKTWNLEARLRTWKNNETKFKPNGGNKQNKGDELVEALGKF